jgi:hypothetical protein
MKVEIKPIPNQPEVLKLELRVNGMDFYVDYFKDSDPTVHTWQKTINMADGRSFIITLSTSVVPR